MVLLTETGTYPDKNLEGDRIVSVSGVKDGGLRVERKVRAQGQLPQLILYEIPRSAYGVGTNAKVGMGRIVREQFVFVHEFEPGKRIIAGFEVQGRLQQIAVQIAVFKLFVLPAPDRGGGP